MSILMPAHTLALARYRALMQRPRTTVAWRAIAARLIAAGIAYSRSGDRDLAAKCMDCAEQALARTSRASLAGTILAPKTRRTLTGVLS